MDDFSEKLAGILNDPDSMNKVRQMAESILGSSGEKEETKAAEPQLPSLSGLGDFSPETLKSIMGILGKLKSKEVDERAALLMALRPHLSEPRQEKLDTAVKILRIIDILPYLKESGILNF